MAVSIDASAVSCAYALEVSPKVLPGTPIWKGLEPNSFPDFGPTYETTARKFIVADRQQLKGSITDANMAGGANIDLTPTNMADLLQGFMLANAREKPATQPFNGTQIAITSVATSGVWNATGIGALFPVGSIYYASGFGNPLNDGFGVVTTSSANSITAAADVTVADAAPAAAANLRQVGVQATSGDLVLTYAAPILTLSSTTLNLSGLGLNVGEWVYLGGDLVATQFAMGTGFARISSIVAHPITFDKTTFTPVADAGTGKTIQIFFGTVIRNENLPANIIRRTYQLERQLGNDTNGVMSEYVTGAYPNSFKYNQPAPGANAKTTVDLEFMPVGYEQYTGAQGVKAGTRLPAPGEGVFSPTADLVRARVAVVDPTTLNPTSLAGYISEASFTIVNNITINKAAGVLGGFSATVGLLSPTGTITAYFFDMTAKAAIKAYNNVTADFIFSKANAGFVMDFPLIDLAGGRLNVELDRPVMLPLTSNAFKGTNGYTSLFNVFQYLPTVSTPSN